MKLPFSCFKSLLIIASFCISFTAHSQPNIPAIEWQKCLGGTLNDAGTCIQQTSDGGYILLGTAASTDGNIVNNPSLPSELWIVKIDAYRNIEWQTFVLGLITLGASPNIIQTTDGGYVVAGAYVTKLTSSGGLDWQTGVSASIVIKTLDGGYAAIFSYSSNITTLTKLNSNGIVEWDDTTFGSQVDGFIAYDAIQLIDSTYLIGGRGYIGTGSHGFTVKIGSGGGQLAGVYSIGHEIVSMKRTLDNGQIVMGYEPHLYVEKHDVAGTIQWSKSFAVPLATKIDQLSDSGYVVSGNVGGNAFILKLTSTGDSSWYKEFGGTGSDAFYYVSANSDNGFVAVGITSSNDGDVSGNHGDADAWVVKFGAFPSSVKETNKGDDIKVYPTLTNDYANVALPVGSESAQLKVIDIMGRQIACRQDVDGLNHTVYFSGLAEGPYYIEVVCKDYAKSYKVLYYRE